MASACDLVVDVRLGLDGPLAECVTLLRAFCKKADDRPCHIACDGWCISHDSYGPCLVGRAKAFLAAIDAVADPKGAA